MVAQWQDSFRRHRGAFGLAALSGALYALGFCGYEQFYLAWICFVPVLWVLDNEHLTSWEALALGWTCGMLAHLSVYTWLINMLRDFGYLPLPLALLGYVLLCAAQSSLFAFWGWAVHGLVNRRGAPLIWTAPIMMVIAEWLYPALFPSYLANSQYRQIWLIQSLDLAGPLGLTFLLTLGSSVTYATAAALWRHRGGLPIASALVLATLVVADLLYGYGAAADLEDTMAHADNQLTLGLVQTNMGMFDRSANPEEGLRRHRAQSMELERQGAQLIVWPESGYYYAIRDGTQNVKREVLGPITTPIVFGGMRLDPTGLERKIYNTAFLSDAGGNLLGHYDKIFLLAFGEFLPLGEFFPFLYKLSPETSRFHRGESVAPLTINGIRFGMLMCYEDILPGFVRRIMRQSPDVLLNLTNDVWFGRSNEPLIHLALATFRAVEQRRYLVRATNTGISAFIDPIGRIISTTPVYARASLLGTVEPMYRTTFYATWGDWVGWLCLLPPLYWWRAPLLRGLGRLRRRPDLKLGT